ncbi:MAG TPA: MarR family winged helix-turn-helix transcriptional regulator, partial [Chloroflexota bacterium]
MAEETGNGQGAYQPPRRLQRLPSWLAGQVARKAELLVGDALAHEGARRPHFAVLTSLAEQGAASQAALGRRLWIDRSDLHAILAELERGGLVARVRDAADRRRNVVTITAAGSAMLSRLDHRIESAQRALLAPLSAGERSELVRLLER